MSLPGFLDLYRQLIAAPSMSSPNPNWDQSNRRVIQLLAGWFAELGFSTHISEVPGMPGKYNLLASLGQGDGGLLLAGHTDTVPYDEGRWTKDPLKLTEEGNRLYGLGSIDMKGFFAFILQACREMDLSRLKQPLRILATADEENTMAGARAIAAAKPIKPRYAVIGEPTGLVPVHMHKGHMSEAIRVTGRAGHSSDPANGLNAIEIMHLVLGELLTLQRELAERYRNTAFAIPQPTLNFGHIHGGDSPNRICGCCELHIDLRPLPGQRADELLAMLNHRLAGIRTQYPGSIEIFDLHEPLPGYACSPHSELALTAEQLTGNKLEAVNYCTEAPFIQELGCDTLVLGPGHIAQAHQPDEYLDLSFVKPTARLLQGMIQKFCF